MIGEIAPLGEFWTVQTARAAMVVYAVALWFRIGMQPRQFAIARMVWTIGLIVFVVHVAVAFDVYHQWSHADAFERTRQQSGSGEGIFVSYLFTLVWAGDVLWWWLRPASYIARSRWISGTVHWFMAFITFNATIIFAEGPVCWFGIVAMTVLIEKFFYLRSQGDLRNQGDRS